MARLAKQESGSWKVYVEHPYRAGSYTSITLGKLPKREAEGLRYRIGQLEACRKAGTPWPPELARWVGQLPPKLRRKLARSGLVEVPGGVTLGQFLQEYLESRKKDLKPGTLYQLQCVAHELVQHWGPDRLLEQITPGDVDELKHALFSRLSPNTARRRLARAKQFFTYAVRKKLLLSNPFEHLRNLTVKPNLEREYYVSVQEIRQLLPCLPDAQWRALIVVYRFQGLRYQEALDLQWEHVLWDQNMLIVPSQKTQREGKGVRVMPLFPETQDALGELWEQASEGESYLFPDLRKRGREKAPGWNHNLRRPLELYILRAGLKPWPKLFQNLRRSCAIDLAERFPAHAVTQWLGHTLKVAQEHYWRVRPELVQQATHFRRLPASSESPNHPQEQVAKKGALLGARPARKAGKSADKPT